MSDHWNSTQGLPQVLTEKLGAGEHEMKLVQSLLELYEEEGLLSDEGEARPLFTDCDRCSDCWTAGDKRPDVGDPAGIAVPWVGPGYKKSRLCVAGLNGNKYGNLGATWWITKCDIEARRGHAEWAGEPTSVHPFYPHTARFIAGLLTETSDFDPNAPVVGSECADLWDSVSFLEAVKCSPHSGSRGSPTPAMVENCPPRYLRQELMVLKPQVLLVVGKGAWRSVADALQIEPPEGDCLAARGTSECLGESLEVFFVAHPAAPAHFVRSVEEFADLRDQ